MEAPESQPVPSAATDQGSLDQRLAQMPKSLKIGVAAVCTIVALALYFVATWEQSAHQNPDRLKHDQSAVLHFSERIVKFGLQYGLNAPRNRMPLYPAFQSLIYRKGMTDDTFFLAAKEANVGLSLVLLAGAFFVFRLYLPLHPSCNALLIAAFGVFALKAPYVQAEELYYFWTFLFFLLMVRLLRRPSWAPALGLGLVLAVAHMTKASTLPAIALFLLFAGLRVAHQAWLARRGARPEGGFLPQVICGPLAIVVFLLLISPYLRISKEKYHSYFYNVNSTFYMWCDSWAEAKAFSDKYDDRHTNPDLSADAASEDLPSFSRYVATHSPGRILGRFVHGLGRMFTETFRSVWYMPYLLFLLAGAVFAALRKRTEFLAALRADPAAPAFVASFFLSYIALYSWWMILARSQRFVLTLFLPLLFVLAWICETYGRGVTLSIKGKTYSFPAVMNWGGTILAVINLPVVLFWAAKAVNGGSTM